MGQGICGFLEANPGLWQRLMILCSSEFAPISDRRAWSQGIESASYTALSPKLTQQKRLLAKRNHSLPRSSTDLNGNPALKLVRPSSPAVALGWAVQTWRLNLPLRACGSIGRTS